MVSVGNMYGNNHSADNILCGIFSSKKSVGKDYNSSNGIRIFPPAFLRSCLEFKSGYIMFNIRRWIYSSWICLGLLKLPIICFLQCSVGEWIPQLNYVLCD